MIIKTAQGAKLRIAKIKKDVEARDYEAAASAEVDLYRDFAETVVAAHRGDTLSRLREIGEAVLTVQNLEFPRQYS